MSTRSDQGTELSGVPSDQLIASALGRGVLDRRMAINELLRRPSLEGRRAMLGILADETAPLDLRSAAALAVGRQPGPETEDALIAALRAPVDSVVRRAAEGLGRHGGERALDALRELPANFLGPTARSVAFARSLISYRLGLGTDLLGEPPIGVLPIERARTVAVRFDRVPIEAFRDASGSLEAALPAIRVAEVGSVRFRCGADDLWMLFADPLMTPDGLRSLATRNRVAAVVLKQSGCSREWYVSQYILTHRRDAQTLEIFGVRPSGTVTHHGELIVNEQNATVRVRALNTPLVLAIDLEATFEIATPDAFTIRAAIATGATTEQQLPRVPRRHVLRVP